MVWHTLGGDLNQEEREQCNNIVKRFGNQVKDIGKQSSVPASNISIFKMNYLFICKDRLNYFFAFVEKNGGIDTLDYKDISSYGLASMPRIIAKLKIELGEVHWIFTVPVNEISNVPDQEIISLAGRYIKSVLQATKKADQKVSDSAMAYPELSKHIEDFRNDYPENKKTAFIIMQFGNSPAHKKIVEVIKETLKKYEIIALRADDKEYSDDLWTNIRTYIHCTDFGISIFERVLSDNFNPNVSLEVGYTMGIDKPICFLKDSTLKNLHTDLMGKLYKPFDPQRIDETLPAQLVKWMQDKGFIK